MDSFELEINCNSGGARHTHKIVIEPGGIVHGSSKPSRVRLEYTCPLTGTAHMATFEPPVGAGRPFKVRKVT
jgi:hypothetical protein